VKILLTGATGFLGQHVGPAISLVGHEVLGTTRDVGTLQEAAIELTPLQMGDDLSVAIRDFAPEVVVHLAWDGIPDFGADRCGENLRTQEEFFQQVLQIPSISRVVVAGTCREYGEESDRKRGCMEATPVDEFGKAKDDLHRALRGWCDSGSVELVWLRIFYAYGPGQRYGSLIPSIIEQAKSGDLPEVRNPEGKHDFVHVSDVAAAFVASVGHENPPPVVDVGWGLAHRVADLVDTVVAVVGGEEVADGPGTVADDCLIANRLTGEALGWFPVVGIVEGVLTMIGSVGNRGS
jgi:nucleoside-diphosphate-sugar epimerase